MMTPIELQERGMAILVRELGYADAVRFILQFSRGRGDYTRRRRRLLANVGLDELLWASANRVKEASRQSRRKGQRR
jgi:hypothetical protein